MLRTNSSVVLGAVVLSLTALGCESQRLPYQWSQASASKHELHLVSEVKLSSTPDPVRFTLEGSSFIAARSTKAGEEVLFDPELRLVAEGVNGEQAAELERALSEPFVVELERGVLVRYHQRPGTPTEVQAVRRFLASLLQHPDGTDRKSGAQWSSEEWDGTGRYAVDYRVEENGALLWKNSGYRQLLYGVGEKHRDVPDDRIRLDVEGHGSSRWDAEGLVELERAAAITAPLAGNASLRSEFQAKLKSRAVVAPLSANAWSEALLDTVIVPVSAPPEAPRTELANRLRAKGRTLEEVFAKLESIQAAGAHVSVRERAEAQGALVALLTENPLLAHQAEAKLALGKLDSSLFEALELASTEEALAVLLRAATNERFDKAKRERAARALIQAPRPPKAALALLLQLREHEEFREHWLLGVGTFVRRYREAGALEEVDAGTRELRGALSTAQTEPARELALLAIANSGEASLFGDVEPFLETKSSRLRVAALQAIRLMADERVEPILRATLSNPEARLVAVALRSLSRRETLAPETVSRVQDLATTHKAADVRLEAVQVLTIASRKKPELKPVLAKIATEDADARVREAAGKAQP